MFYKKTIKKLIMKLESYAVQVDTCFDNFRKSMDIYLEFNAPREEEFTKLVKQTHESESFADDKRVEFELYLYESKKLLPHSRSNVYSALETFDRIPNKAESILFMIHCENLLLPEEMKTGIKELTDINIEAYKKTRHLFTEFFTDPASIPKNIKQIDESESASDKKERNMIVHLFDMDFDTGTKLLLKELILNIGGISDRCEIVGNNLHVHSMKTII